MAKPTTLRRAREVEVAASGRLGAGEEKRDHMGEHLFTIQVAWPSALPHRQGPTVAPGEGDVLQGLGGHIDAVSTEKERAEEPGAEVCDGTQRNIVTRHAVISLRASRSTRLTSDLSKGFGDFLPYYSILSVLPSCIVFYDTRQHQWASIGVGKPHWSTTLAGSPHGDAGIEESSNRPWH